MLPDALSTQNTLHDNLLTDHQVTCSHEAAVTDRESVPAEDVPDEKWTQWGDRFSLRVRYTIIATCSGGKF